MPRSSSETSQLAPSQFAYFRTVQPTTTASGVVPGRAPLDTPSPGRAPSPPLQRSQRSRKPTTRKVEGEASQVQPGVSRSQGKKPARLLASKRHGKNTGNPINASTSKSATIAESPDGDSAMANPSGARADLPKTQRETQGGYESQGGEDRSEYEYETLPIDPLVIEQIELLLGHSIEHLSETQVKNLAEKMAETQTLAMDTQIQPATTIAQSFAGAGLASGDRNGSPSHEDTGERLLSQGPKATTSSKGSLSTQKRRLDSSLTNTVPKRARIETDKDDTATESEPSDSNRSTSDSDSEREDPPLPKSRGSILTATGSRPIIAGRGFAQPPARPPVLSLSNPPGSTSAATASAATTSAASYLLRHPPPTDITNNEALVNWALRIAADQARGPNPSPNSSNPDASRRQQPEHPATTTTTGHVTQAITSHRAQRATTEHLESQQNAGSPSQATTSVFTPIVTPPTETNTTPGKKKHRRKTKLSDFPGRVGEIASAAIPYFLATVVAQGGYENLDTFQDWALDAYRRSSDLEYPDEYEPPPVAVLKVMTRRASWLRGEIKKRLRAGVEYGYGFRNPAVSRTDIKHNRRLAKKLKPEVFHCKNLVFDTDQFEHPQLVRAIGAGLFWDPESLGVAFKDRFNPVPIPAVALVLTMMQACIAEWKEGRHKAIELDLDTQTKVYESHLLSLYSYETIAASRLTRFRTRWASEGLDYSCATFDEDPTQAKSYVLSSNVRPDTPPPQSDNDD